MRAPGPRIGAVLTVFLGAATGVVTNLITSKWTWTLAAVLAVLVLASATLAALTVGGQPRIRQAARRRSLIRGSGIRASGHADISQTASSGSGIVDSPITVDPPRE